MQLNKQHLLTISITESVLGQNFTQIQSEFRKIRHELKNLSNNSKMIIQKINQLDPYDQMQFQPTELNPMHFQNELGCKQDKGFIQSYNSLNQLNNQVNFGNGVSNVNLKVEPEADQSQTALEAKQNIDILNSQTNQLKNRQNKRQPQSRQSEVSLSRNSRKFQKEKNVQKTGKNSSDSMLRQFIKQLQNRLSQLQKQKANDQTRIALIQKDNQRIKKILGFGESKSRNQQKKQQHHKQSQKKQGEKQKSSKKSIIQNCCIETEQQKMNGQIGSSDQIIQQNNFMTSLTKQFNELKQYIKSKVILLQNCLEKCSGQIGQQKVDINLIKTDIKENKIKLQNIQLRDQQNNKCLASISRTRILDQKQKQPHSIYSKVRTSASEIGNLNDTVQSYKNYYEDKIVEIFQQMDKIRAEYFNMMDKLNAQGEITNDQEKLKSLASKICSITNPNQQKLKKQISSLRKQHRKLREQFNELIGEVNTGTNETRTLIIKPNQNKQDWKDVTNKIFRLKQELLSYVKELENKINLNNDMAIVIQELQVGLSQCKILNGRKKFSKRIENRLNNFIRQSCEKQGIVNQQQALIAKQPWFCLSCDSQIKTFSGKLGKTISNEKFTGKKVNPESHMVRRPDQSKLPSVH